MYSWPLHSEKNWRRGVCGGGGDCAQASLRRILCCLKTVNNKIPVSSVLMIVKDCAGRNTVCRCLFRRPHYSARLMRFGSRAPCEFFFSDTPPKFAFTEIGWEDAEQGLGMVMSTLASEKNRLFFRTITRSGLFTTTTRILEFVVFLCKLRLLFFNPQRD